MTFSRKTWALTFQSDGNPYAFVRIRTVALRLGNGELGPRVAVLREPSWMGWTW